LREIFNKNKDGARKSNKILYLYTYRTFLLHPLLVLQFLYW